MIFFSLIYCQLLSGYNINQLALTLQPDINALAENLRFDKRTLFVLLHNLSGWQSVQNVLIAAAFEVKAQSLQMPAVHKLDALTELALFKAFGIWYSKMLVCNRKAFDSVDAVNCREGIVLNLKLYLLLIFRRKKGNQIEIEFGEHDAYRLHSALHLHAISTTVGNRYLLLFAHSATQLPHLLQKLIFVLRLYIKQLFVAYKLAYTLLLCFGDTAVNQLIDNRVKLLFGEGPAFQQYFERGENLFVGQQIA